MPRTDQELSTVSLAEGAPRHELPGEPVFATG